MSDPVQDRAARAMGAAARAMGVQTHAFRPRGAHRPLAPENRFLRLPAAMQVGARFGRAARTDAPLWQGVFDTAYTAQGDYLVQGESIFFIAAQPRLLAATCVKTNRLVSIQRAGGAVAVGINPYGGATRTELSDIMTEWPASMLGVHAAGWPRAHLPADVAESGWTVLLPPIAAFQPRPGDLLRDDLGRAGAIGGMAETEFGWRLAVREAHA